MKENNKYIFQRFVRGNKKILFHTNILYLADKIFKLLNEHK